MRSQAKELELSASAKLRLAWFAFAFDHEGNVSLTCTHFGISRSTYHRWAKRFDPADTRTLEERSKRPRRVRGEETPKEIIDLIREYRLRMPTAGKAKISRLILEEHGHTVSSSTVGRVIARHGFFFGNSESHRLKRARHEAAQQDAAEVSNGSAASAEDFFGIYAT